jgi:hypothetical protein
MILWPSGITDVFTDVPVNQNKHVLEGEAAVSVSQEVLQNSMQVQPNPSSGTIHVTFQVRADEAIAISIFNLQGTRVLALPDTNYSKGLHSVAINLQSDGIDLPPGEYLLILQVGAHCTSAKVVLAE